MNVETGTSNSSVALASTTDGSLNWHQRIVVIILDVLLIGELCISIHFANQNPQAFTPVFMKYFFAMLVPTLIAARILIKKFRTKDP